MEGKRIVGSPQCPSCYRDVLPGTIDTECVYDDIYLGGDPLCRGHGYASLDPVRRNLVAVIKTHKCGYVFPNNFKMKWVMEDDNVK